MWSLHKISQWKSKLNYQTLTFLNFKQILFKSQTFSVQHQLLFSYVDVYANAILVEW